MTSPGYRCKFNGFIKRENTNRHSYAKSGFADDFGGRWKFGRREVSMFALLEYLHLRLIQFHRRSFGIQRERERKREANSASAESSSGSEHFESFLWAMIVECLLTPCPWWFRLNCQSSKRFHRIKKKWWRRLIDFSQVSGRESSLFDGI